MKKKIPISKKFLLHPEITCPFCRVGFGGLKVSQIKPTKKWYELFKVLPEPEVKSIIHLDIFWSREAGMHVDCKNIDLLKTKIDKIDENGNPIFQEEFQLKLKELVNKYSYYPDDLSKDTCEWRDFQITFSYLMNWGMIDGDYEEYNRESMKWEDIKIMYDEGKSVYEALRHYVIMSPEQE